MSRTPQEIIKDIEASGVSHSVIVSELQKRGVDTSLIEPKLPSVQIPSNQEALNQLAPSNVLEKAGVASANAPGIYGTVMNSIPGIGDPNQIIPSIQNIQKNPGQLKQALKRIVQTQGGSELTPQEQLPATMGKMAGTVMEIAGVPGLDNAVEATTPFRAGVRSPSTAIPEIPGITRGSFRNAGEALGKAKELSNAGINSSEVDAVLTRLEDPKKAEKMLTEARQWVNSGMQGKKSIPELMAYQDVLGKAQSEGSKFADVYAKSAKKIADKIAEIAPDLAAKLKTMAINYAARGNPRATIPWFTGALKPAVGVVKSFTLPQVQNALGAIAGVGSRYPVASSTLLSQALSKLADIRKRR